MKKLITFLALALVAVVLRAQFPVTVSGTLYTPSGTPVSNQAVYIQTDSSFLWMGYYGVATTDPNGFYSHTFTVPSSVSSGNVAVYTDSCSIELWAHYSFANTPAQSNFSGVDFYVGGCNGGGSGCTAGFQLWTSGTTAYFYDSSYAQGGVAAYSWSFGDGTGASGANPVHTYASPGTYTVCLSITSANGCADTVCSTITISGGGPCNAQFTSSTSGLTAFFNDLSTGITPNTSVSWTYGDGICGLNPQHTYTASGTYFVCLTLWDSTGCNSTYCDSVTVSNGGVFPCQADFYWYADSLQPNTVWVVNAAYGSNGTTPSSYLWDFGDGSTSTLAYPTHTYSNSGVYTVCLTITDATGCTSTFCDSINATPKANASWTLNVIPNTPTAVDPSLTKLQASLVPNPAADRTALTFNMNQAGDITLLVRSLDGRTLLERNEIRQAGSQELEIGLSGLTSGIYLVELRTPTGRFVGKLVKN